MINQKELKKILHYDKSTGLFIWKVAKGKRAKIGDMAGSTHKISGYVYIKINSKRYLAHRLAWLYITGKYPQNHIDHKNHNREDNKISNLRDITQQQNNKNRKKSKNNTSGANGVSWCKITKRWKAQISIDDKVKNLGRFTDFSDALNARKNAEILYSYYENHGV